MHRTYYELEDYHWESIKKKGFTEGVEVWFADPECYQDKFVKNGVITGHDITLDGDVLLEIEWIDLYNWEISENIWVTDEKDRKGVREDKSTARVYMNWAFFTREEAAECAKRILGNKISRAEDQLDYRKRRLEKFETSEKPLDKKYCTACGEESDERDERKCCPDCKDQVVYDEEINRNRS